MKNLTKVILFLIVILAFFLRVYRVDEIPPSISWDEAGVGYNAYSIANYGRDEWGVSLPVAFKSFGDDKSPVHIYLTALSVKLFDLSEFSTRVPMVVFGVADVVLLFFLGSLWFSEEVGLIAAFFLSISPYNIQFSRFNHEAVIALFFFMAGVYLFVRAVKGLKTLLPFSAVSFCVCMLTYPSSKIVIPLMILLMVTVYFKDLFWKLKKQTLISIGIFLLFGVFVLIHPEVLGLTRAKQASTSPKELMTTQFYSPGKDLKLVRVELDVQRYLSHFSSQYLFISGDAIPRHSIQTVGEFYKVDLLFLIAGAIYLLFKISKKNKGSMILLGWSLLAPLPASISGGLTEAPHAARSLFMMGSWNLVAAVGLFAILKLLKKKNFKLTALGITILILVISLKIYLNDYYNGEYSKRYAIEWQYGMKQIVSYVIAHPEYTKVYMTEERSQPYIFFLYYLKVPLPEYLKSVVYNQKDDKSHNLVLSFKYKDGTYFFGGWDKINSSPDRNSLYALTPSEYDGLRYKLQFQLKDKVSYPNGTDAYFLVSKF